MAQRQVDLDGIELGLGKMLPGPGSRGAGDVAVRLSLGDAVSEPGELHLPEDLEEPATRPAPTRAILTVLPCDVRVWAGPSSRSVHRQSVCSGVL